MPRLKLTWPVRPFKINQHFADNIPCVKDFGLPTQRIVDGEPNTCPPGYDKLYSHFDMAGHNGTDLAAGRQPVYAACAGTVIEQQLVESRGLGLGIVTDEPVDLDCGTYYAKLRYWHLASFNVTAGDHVTQGQQIGVSDNTGYSSGNHLHFELQPMTKTKSGKYILAYPDGNIAGAVSAEPYFMTPQEAKEAQISVLEQLILAFKTKLGINTGGTGTSSYTTGMFTINWMDVLRGLFVAVFTGAWISVAGLFVSGFDVFTADWVMIGKIAVNGGFFAFVGYINKNLLTASNGKIFGII